MDILFNLGHTLRSIILTVVKPIQWLPPLLARIAVGAVFANTGWGKLHNLPRIVEYFRSLGIPNPELQAPFVATNEFVWGICIILGLFTRVAAIPLAITMLVAIKTAKMAEVHHLFDLFGLDEFLFLLIFIWLAVQGPGPVSIDSRLSAKR